jgi:peroxisomal 3,2-trans-enoyl-CoA isomerase
MMSSPSPSPSILISYRPKLAIITLNCPQKLNALSGEAYYALARAMNEVASRSDIYITVLTGTGRFFSAGADVTFGSQKADTSSIDERQVWLKSFVANNLYITHAFYVRSSSSSHPYSIPQPFFAFAFPSSKPRNMKHPTP